MSVYWQVFWLRLKHLPILYRTVVVLLSLFTEAFTATGIAPELHRFPF